MSTNTGVTQGSRGYVGVKKQSAKGTFAASGADEFLLVDGPPTLAAKYDLATNQVYAGGPDTNRSQRVTKAKVGGNLAHPLYIDMGLPIFACGLGLDTYLASLTADTVKTATPIVTSALISTITLTNSGGVTYTQYAWISVNTGASTEWRQILSISGNGAPSTIITVAALFTNAAAAAGTAVQQLAQHKMTPVYNNVYPWLSVEENVGNAYAWQYLDGLVNKTDLKAAKDKFQVTHDLMFDAQRQRPGTPTAFNIGAQTDTNLTNPYTYTDGFLILGADQLASGASSQQQILEAEDWSFSMDNKVIQKALPDATDFYRVFPGGERTFSGEYTIINRAGRQAIFEDYVKPNVEIPFVASNARNIGTVSSPNIRAFGLVLPNTHVADSEEVRVLSDVVGEKAKFNARYNPNIGDVCQIFAITGKTSAY